MGVLVLVLLSLRGVYMVNGKWELSGWCTRIVIDTPCSALLDLGRKSVLGDIA